MKKPEEMTVPQYNELMMKDAEEMLNKALWCVAESQSRLQIAVAWRAKWTRGETF